MPVVIRSKSVRPDRTGRLVVKLSCPKADVLCDGWVKFSIGSPATFLIMGGRSQTERVRLTAKQLEAARRRKAIALHVRSRDQIGLVSDATAKLKLLKR
jgi:hypothetical protein